jgi:hypothetical protein
MANDRGTIPRGSVTDQWGEPTAPAGRRMPSAPRERRPALAALAALLVLVGATAAGLLVMRAGRTIEVIEVTQAIGQGEQIPGNQLEAVQIAANSGFDYVPWSEVTQVEKAFAAQPIPRGTLLTENMTVASYNLTNGDALEGIFLKAGEVPPDLQIGDKVEAFSTGTQTTCGVPSATDLGTGTVTGVLGEASGQSSTTVVTLAVPQSSNFGQLACEAANDQVALVTLPSNGPANGAGNGG